MEDPIRAVLLDVDGTLIDSNDAHAQSWVDVGEEYGYPIVFEDVRRLIGMGGDKVLPELTGLSQESERGAEILKRRGEIFRAQYLPQLTAFPLARDLLERLRSDGYVLVVATSASDEDLSGLLDQAGIADLIARRTSADDAEESKPAPDIIEAALEAAKCGATEAVLVGDTPYDVAAGRRAGVRVIALRCGGWDDEALSMSEAIYDAPAQLLELYDETVFGRSGRGKKVEGRLHSRA
jgi:HAD superfamily hydrolase (TIGR01509 family)